MAYPDWAEIAAQMVAILRRAVPQGDEQVVTAALRFDLRSVARR